MHNISMKRMRREFLGSKRTQTMNDIFYDNRQITIDQSKNEREIIVITLPSDEEYLKQLKQQSDEKFNLVDKAVKQWNKLNDTTMSWQAFGITTRLDLGKIVQQVTETNCKNSIFNGINGETLIRCDIEDTQILLTVKNIDKIDLNWHETMVEELKTTQSGLIDDMCSIKVIKKHDNNILCNNIDCYEDLWKDSDDNGNDYDFYDTTIYSDDESNFEEYESDLLESEKDKISDEEVKRMFDIYENKYGKDESDFDFSFKQDKQDEQQQIRKTKISIKNLQEKNEKLKKQKDKDKQQQKNEHKQKLNKNKVDVQFMHDNDYVFYKLNKNTWNRIVAMNMMIDDGDWDIDTLKRSSEMDKLFKQYCGEDEYKLILKTQEIAKGKTEDELLELKKQWIHYNENIDKANVLKETGNDYFASYDYKDAIKWYNEAIKLIPDNPVYYLNRALARIREDEYKLAEMDCTMAILLDSDPLVSCKHLLLNDKLFKAFYRRGMARIELFDYEGARSDFEMVLKLHTGKYGNHGVIDYLQMIQQLIMEEQQRKNKIIQLEKAIETEMKKIERDIRKIKIEMEERQMEEFDILKEAFKTQETITSINNTLCNSGQILQVSDTIVNKQSGILVKTINNESIKIKQQVQEVEKQLNQVKQQQEQQQHHENISQTCKRKTNKIDQIVKQCAKFCAVIENIEPMGTAVSKFSEFDQFLYQFLYDIEYDMKKVMTATEKNQNLQSCKMVQKNMSTSLEKGEKKLEELEEKMRNESAGTLKRSAAKIDSNENQKAAKKAKKENGKSLERREKELKKLESKKRIETIKTTETTIMTAKMTASEEDQKIKSCKMSPNSVTTSLEKGGKKLKESEEKTMEKIPREVQLKKLKSCKIKSNKILLSLGKGGNKLKELESEIGAKNRKIINETTTTTTTSNYITFSATEVTGLNCNDIFNTATVISDSNICYSAALLNLSEPIYIFDKDMTASDNKSPNYDDTMFNFSYIYSIDELYDNLYKTTTITNDMLLYNNANIETTKLGINGGSFNQFGTVYCNMSQVDYIYDDFG